MKPFYILLLLLPVSIITNAQGKTAKAFTVKEAVEYAIQNNNTAKNAQLGVDEAKWRNMEIYTTGLPQITSSLDYSYYFKQPISPAFNSFFSDTTSAFTKVFSYLATKDINVAAILYNSAIQSKDSKFSFMMKNNLNTSLQISQLFFDGRYVFGVKAAKDLMRNARLSAQMSNQDVKYSVMKAYYQAEAAQEVKSLLHKNLELVDTLLYELRATFRQGFIEELDVNRVELAQANLQSQINIQNQMAEVALANLKFQMGMKLSDEIILKDNLTELKKEISPDLAEQFDPKNRVEYQLLETGIRLKGFDLRQRRVQYFPSLYGFLNYGWNAQAQKMGDFFKSTTVHYPDGDTRKTTAWYDQGVVGLSLKVPIFDSGSKLAQVKQAKIQQLKLQNDFENFKNASELQYKAAQSGFSSALAEEANTKRTEELSKKIYRKNVIKFKAGVGNSFELVQSESDYVTNQLKYIQSMMNLLNSKADMDKAMGK